MSEAPELPPAIDLVRAFVNSYEYGDDDHDAFRTKEELRDWFFARGMVDAKAVTTDRDRKLAVSLREALRLLLLRNHDEDAPVPPQAARDLETAADDLHLTAVVDVDGGVVLEPAASGVRGALAQVVAASVQATADGTWSRLKVCASDTCEWAFYDVSKNHSRRWCSMAVCGNRMKTQEFRARQRASAT